MGCAARNIDTDNSGYLGRFVVMAQDGIDALSPCGQAVAESIGSGGKALSTEVHCRISATPAALCFRETRWVLMVI